MNRIKFVTVFALLIVLLVLAVQIDHFLEAAETQVINVDSLTRDLEPVVISGSDLSQFVGAGLNEIRVYAYSAGQWRIIPSQIDEVALEGVYVSTEDGVFDANDELVFMAKDMALSLKSVKTCTLDTGSLSGRNSLRSTDN